MLSKNGQLHAQCYTEIKNKDNVQHTTSGSPLTHQRSAVLCLQPVFDGAHVAAIHEDGTLSVRPWDCAAEVAQTALREANCNIKIHTVEHMSAVAAKGSVFKSRSDLTLVLTDDNIVTPIVYEYIGSSRTSDTDFHYAVWCWSLRPHLKPVQLLKHDLGVMPSPRNFEVRFNSASKAYMLDLVNESWEMAFDLTKIVPNMVKKVRKTPLTSSTYVDVSDDIRLYASQDDIQLHNRSFSSLLSIREHEKQGDSKRKRHTVLKLLAYFPHLKRALGHTKTHLVAIDLLPAQGSDLTFKQSSLLIGNISRGSSARPVLGSDNVAISVGETVKKTNPSGWGNVSADLRALIERHDINGFEDAFLTSVEHELGRNTMLSVPAEFVLSIMFGVSTASSSGLNVSPALELKVFAPRLLKWCIQHDFLTDQVVHRALASQQHRTSWLPLGCVVGSLFEHDTNLDVLEHYVLYSPYIEPKVLAILIKKFISIILASAVSRPLATEDARMIDVDDRAVALITAQPSLRIKAQSCLLHSLHLLSLAGAATITRQFRDILSQNDTLALIQLLRQQLFQGGFTRRPDSSLYPTPPASTNGEVNDSHPNMTAQLSLPSISVLLNGCIDTLGPLGILDSNTDATQTQFLERLVPELLSEIQSAAEAIEESADLQGLLRETLRYVQSVQKQEQNTLRDHSTLHTTQDVKSGRIRVVYTEPEADEEMDVNQAALPISLRAREEMDRYKVRKGGGQASRRSKREAGTLMDRTRSAYSFERLVF